MNDRRHTNYLYIATGGDDANPGTEDKPLKTIARARDAVRELKKKEQAPITVMVLGGVYYLTEPLLFTPEDSGFKEAPITYSAYPGEKPVISGAAVLELNWARYRDGIMMASVPAGLDFDQLFVNGHRQIRARYPNFDPEHPLMGEGGYINATGGSNERREFYFDPATFTKKKWSKPAEAIVHIFPSHYWHNAQYHIKAIDWERNAIRLGEGGWQTHEFIAHNNFTGNSRFFVDNVFEELDTPEEWYLDREKSILYYLPPENLNLQRAIIEVPRLKRLVELKGSSKEPIQHLRLAGFRFTQTMTTFMDQYEVPSTGDWGIHRGGAVFVEGAEDCAVEGSFFDAVGGNALFVSNHARCIRVCGNTFSYTGDSAVCLCGQNNMIDSEWRCEYCDTPRPWDFTEIEDYPAECLVSNNRMHHIGVYGKQTAGVFISISRHNTVSHNHIYFLPRAGICINDPFWGGHVIEYNDIHDTVLESDDHGPFNAWGRGHYWCLSINQIKVSHEAGDVKRDSRFPTIIRYNRFRDRSNGGITLDDGASNFHVYCNLLIGIGFQNREGEYRILENNILINPSMGVGYDVLNENNHDQFLRNIVVINADYIKVPDHEGDTSYKQANVSGESRYIYRVRYPPLNGKWVDEIDYNLLYNYADGFPAINYVPRKGQNPKEGETWEEWQALGYDRHSKFDDPLFIDPANGDFRVRPESPALKLGFYNFTMEHFGLLPEFPDTWENEPGAGD